MTNETYYSKSQILKVAESLRPIAGNGITDAFIKGIEGVEGQEPHILPDVAWSEIKLEWRPYYEHNVKHIHIAIDRTYSKEQIEFVLREMLEQVLTMTEEEKHGPLI